MEEAVAVEVVHEDFQPRSVLIVEDNLDGREALRELLELWGYDVEVAETGPQALEAALVNPPAVALIDIGLPGLDGYEVARRLRSRLGRASVRLIAMSGYGQPEDRQRSLEAGFDLHLVKPVAPEKLRDLLETSPE